MAKLCAVCSNPFSGNNRDEGWICCSRECSQVYRGSFEERFWARVNKKGRIVRKSLGHCWEFQAAPLPNGYIHVKKPDGKSVLVHRESWIMTNGPIPEGLLICHKCDNKPCIRPTHLFPGTQAENLADMDRKGRRRQVVGEKHGRSKLTEQQVLQLLSRYRSGKWTQKSLADEYGLHSMTVHKIVTGKKWAHLQEQG